LSIGLRDPDGKKLLDSAIIEQDYDSLPSLYSIERDDPPEAPQETESPAESDCFQPLSCNAMRHDFENCDDVAPALRHPGPHSCPVPPDVLKARYNDVLKSIEQTPVPKIEKEDSPAAAEANEEECWSPSRPLVTSTPFVDVGKRSAPTRSGN
jgi:hypothetical protein